MDTSVPASKRFLLWVRILAPASVLLCYFLLLSGKIVHISYGAAAIYATFFPLFFIAFIPGIPLSLVHVPASCALITFLICQSFSPKNFFFFGGVTIMLAVFIMEISAKFVERELESKSGPSSMSLQMSMFFLVLSPWVFLIPHKVVN